MIAFVRKQSAAYILKWLLLIVVVSAFVLSVNPEQVYAVQAPSPEPDPEKLMQNLLPAIFLCLIKLLQPRKTPPYT